ncbi:YhjD/YihY/BrkB family envelope integrity protein [Streptacidiphilus sp. N1-12]|uniref:YhjD/YihY/BrkB family envelope integrity protein n=2 Tax=Streptacidiphilus alkalitolerans TaxID=3342712 RepID=A0ABV6WI53_9ACTN
MTPLPPPRKHRPARQALKELPATAQRLRVTAEQRLPVITRLTAQLLVINILDVATRLAAQLFLTSVPLLFAIAAFAPQFVRDQLVESVRTVFGLTGQPLDQLTDLYRNTDDAFVNTTGVIGALMALMSATACSRVVQRLCEKSWGLPKAGARIAVWRWFAWICSWLVILIAQQPLRTGFGAGLWLGIPLSFLASALVWWWTQHLLLGPRSRWRPLLPGAVLTAVAMTALSMTALIYMPLAINNSQQKFGSLGPVFTMLSWLIVLCVGIVGGIALGQVLATEPPLSHWAGPVLHQPEPGPEAEPAATAGPEAEPGTESG